VTATDTTTRSQTESISFGFDLPHSPGKVWRAKISYAWVVGDIDTVVTFTLTPNVRHATLPRAVSLQATPEAELRRRTLWLEMMGARLVDLLASTP
jgi:hypothetical protein